ncbi:putative mannose-6-phosphate isomerase GmuF [compost metagenome]
MSYLYPFKFKTIFKEKIWGGQKINTFLRKDFLPLTNCGETWEISGVENNVSVVANGKLSGTDLNTLIEQHPLELLGESVFRRFGAVFPLLVKFIDANEDLSIQVHPGDALARKRHDSFGKTEMWYVLQADSDASLISGFNQDVDRSKYLEKFNEGKLTDILNRENVVQGDLFFLPAGRVHTIGKGLLIAEIQQSSDITYRIYDFDRVDDEGKTRQLHTEEALDAIDYQYYPQYKSSYAKVPNEINEMVDCEYFTTNFIALEGALNRSYSHLDSFKILVVVEGSFKLTFHEGELDCKLGDCILIPASVDEVSLQASGSAKILESYIR